MTARRARDGHRLAAWAVALVLAGALPSVSGVHAQEPTPESMRPVPSEDPPRREPQADAAPAAPRPAPRRRPAADTPPAAPVPPAAADGDDADAGVAPPRAHRTDSSDSTTVADATDARDGGTAEPSAVPDLYAGDPLDGGAPALPTSDAGVADASAPAVAAVTPAGAQDAGPAHAPPVVPVPVPTTTFVQLPAPFVPPSEPTDPWEGFRKIIPGIPAEGISPESLFVLLVLLAAVSGGIERLRARLLRDGWLPALLSFLQVSVRLVALLVGLSLVIQVVPGDVRWVVYFILMASGAALGWSMRDVMPDLIAGVVILFERRIRRGVWIRTAEFSGAVERVGLRSSWLRDPNGDRVAVPNRMLMQNPVLTDEEGATVHEVAVRMRGGTNAVEVRRALRDAVLASPWTRPHAEPEVLRDPSDPELWRVRARLLSASFAAEYEGQLLERAEAHLAAQPSPAVAPTLDKSEKPDKTEKTERAPKAP